MRLPRFLWVPFELGRPFGAPHDPDFQRRVLLDALALFERSDGPVVLADFPDDAPDTEDHDIPWACPVSYVRPAADEPEPLSAVRTEIAQLTPWAELAVAPVPNSDLSLDEMIERLATISEGGESGAGGPVDVEAIRLMADDLRTWYLHAVARQPGQASSHDRNTWFWRQTALAHLLGHIAATLSNHDEPRVRAYAERGIVPRDHWDHLVPSTPSGDNR